MRALLISTFLSASILYLTTALPTPSAKELDTAGSVIPDAAASIESQSVSHDTVKDDTGSGLSLDATEKAFFNMVKSIGANADNLKQTDLGATQAAEGQEASPDSFLSIIGEKMNSFNPWKSKLPSVETPAGYSHREARWAKMMENAKDPPAKSKAKLKGEKDLGIQYRKYSNGEKNLDIQYRKEVNLYAEYGPNAVRVVDHGEYIPGDYGGGVADAVTAIAKKEAHANPRLANLAGNYYKPWVFSKDVNDFYATRVKRTDFPL